MEERRGQRSEKRLSLRHCHTILPDRRLDIPVPPSAPPPNRSMYVSPSLSVSFSLSIPLFLYLHQARLLDHLSRFLERSIILPLHLQQCVPLWPLPTPFLAVFFARFHPLRMTGAETRSVEESAIVSVSLGLLCYSSLLYWDAILDTPRLTKSSVPSLPYVISCGAMMIWRIS